MAKKIAVVKNLVEVQTDAERLATLMGSPVPQPVEDVIPTIPVETPIAEPTPTPVIPQAVSAEQVLAFLTANPEVLRAAYAQVAPQSNVTVTLRPTVTKSTQKKCYVNLAFSEKPAAGTIAELKAAKYRWSPFNKVWYGPGDALVNHSTFGADIRSALV